MSEKKPFDVAIAVLKTELQECSPDEEDEFCDFIQSLTDNQYEKGLWIAIHVLEAAGKVEKKEALASLDDIYLSASVSPWDRSVKHLGIVRSLLESLPDKEEK